VGAEGMLAADLARRWALWGTGALSGGLWMVGRAGEMQPATIPICQSCGGVPYFTLSLRPNFTTPLHPLVLLSPSYRAGPTTA